MAKRNEHGSRLAWYQIHLVTLSMIRGTPGQRCLQNYCTSRNQHARDPTLNPDVKNHVGRITSHIYRLLEPILVVVLVIVELV